MQTVVRLGPQVEAFAEGLRPHQKAVTSDGTTVLERAVVEHNLAAASRLYNNIYFVELGQLLGVPPATGETIAARMIAEDRLQVGSGAFVWLPFVGLSQEGFERCRVAQQVPTLLLLPSRGSSGPFRGASGEVLNGPGRPISPSWVMRRMQDGQRFLRIGKFPVHVASHVTMACC